MTYVTVTSTLLEAISSSHHMLGINACIYCLHINFSTTRVFFFNFIFFDVSRFLFQIFLSYEGTNCLVASIARNHCMYITVFTDVAANAEFTHFILPTLSQLFYPVSNGDRIF